MSITDELRDCIRTANRNPDPSFWKVIDNREAAQMLQGILDVVDG